MGLFDLFRKKQLEDGTYHREDGMSHRDRNAEMRAAYEGSSFCMTVQDVFTIMGRGTVVTGQVESGAVTVGDSVTLRRTDGSSREVVIAGIEMFRKMLDTAVQGDNVGLLLRGVERNEVGPGDVLEKMWQGWN